MHFTRFIGGVAAAISIALGATGALAQAYPSKAITFVVPFPPGGTLDVLTRLIGEKMATSMGVPHVVENKPGAAGAIGAEYVTKQPGDGYTVMIVSNTIVTLPALRPNLPFDPLKDLTPVVLLSDTPTVVTVHPSLGAKTWPEFVNVAKTKAGGLSYSSPGNASPPHLTGELLSRGGGLPMTHVPYNGTAPAVRDLLGGHTPVMMAPLNAVLPSIKEGKLIAIAAADATRAPDLPELKTLNELGVNIRPVSSWFAFLTAPNTPPAIVERLNAEANKALKLPDVQAKLKEQTFGVRGGTSAELAKLMADDAAANAKIVKDAGIKM